MDSSSNLQNNLKSKTFDSISKSKKTPQNTAILLVSHGSSLPYAEEVFTEIRDKYIKLTGFDAEAGYMKVANPTLPQAINNLKDKNPNLKYIIAVPVFLAPGIHTRIDIPTILGLEPLETDPRCPDGNYPEGHYLYDLEDINFDGEIIELNVGKRDSWEIKLNAKEKTFSGDKIKGSYTVKTATKTLKDLNGDYKLNEENGYITINFANLPATLKSEPYNMKTGTEYKFIFDPDCDEYKKL